MCRIIRLDARSGGDFCDSRMPGRGVREQGDAHAREGGRAKSRRSALAPRLLRLLQQFTETGEWLVCRRRRSVRVGRLGIGVGYVLPSMLILVTVETQQLPIASVWRVIVVVVILVMHGELAKSYSGKVAPAPPAHGRKQPQRTGSVAAVAPFAISASLGNDVAQVVAGRGFCCHQRSSVPPRSQPAGCRDDRRGPDQRHLTVERRIRRPVDLPHPALADEGGHVKNLDDRLDPS